MSSGRPFGKTTYRLLCCPACGDLFVWFVYGGVPKFCSKDCYLLGKVCCTRHDRTHKYKYDPNKYRSASKTLREDLAWLYEEADENAKPALRVGSRSTTPRAKHYG